MFKELDPLLHSQLRLAVMSILLSVEEAEFVYIKEKTSATAGNLSVQLDKLNEAGYIEIEKGFAGKKPRTVCRITDKGRLAMEEYCTDFNEALAKLNEFIITTDTYKRLKQKRDSIETIMPLLNDYPSNCKDAYNELVSIYADADELFRFADDPRGSLSTYSTKTTDLFQKIEKSMKEFKVKHIQNKADTRNV